VWPIGIPGFIAIVFEPLPERIDPFYAILTAAGVGSLLGSGLGALTRVSRAQRAVYAETGSLVLALWGLAFFVVGSLIQGVG
jgi:hypothetical protein